jgi:hypothetical protein
MNMPGFTGEASLYKTSRQYYKAGNLTQTDGVYPAIDIFDWLKSTAVRYPWSITTHYPVHREFTTRCCSSCQYSCWLHCHPLFRSWDEYSKCINSCHVSCTPHCNAAEFGGCDELLSEQ